MVSIVIECDKCGVSHTIKGTFHLYIDSGFEYKGWFIDENGTGCLCPRCYSDVEYQRLTKSYNLNKSKPKQPINEEESDVDDCQRLI